MTFIAENRIARQRYFILESVTAGISLTGTEVKACKEGRVQMRDSFARIMNEEAFLLNCHISAYSHGNIMNHDPVRTRKLLLKKSEIRRLSAKVMQKGMTLVPLKFFLKKRLVKVEIGLCKGKELADKRETIKRREADREMARALRGKM